IAALRKTEPKKLGKLVRGDLDWIVMKALEKDRGRRYETANGFAMDLQRYLADEPVLAGPPRAGYRLRKFVRRHRATAAVAGLVGVSLVVGIAGASVGLVRALNAEAAARRDAEAARAARQEAADRLADVVTERDRAAKSEQLAAEEAELAREIARFLQTDL